MGPMLRHLDLGFFPLPPCLAILPRMGKQKKKVTPMHNPILSSDTEGNSRHWKWKKSFGRQDSSPECPEFLPPPLRQACRSQPGQRAWPLPACLQSCQGIIPEMAALWERASWAPVPETWALGQPQILAQSCLFFFNSKSLRFPP